VKIWFLASCLSRSLKVIGTDTNRSATNDFLLTFHSNHGPISYCLRDKRAPAEGVPQFPLELGIGGGCQILEWRGYRAEKEVWLYLQPSGCQYTNMTDRQTLGDSKDRAYAYRHAVKMDTQRYIWLRNAVFLCIKNAYLLQKCTMLYDIILRIIWSLQVYQ